MLIVLVQGVFTEENGITLSWSPGSGSREDRVMSDRVVGSMVRAGYSVSAMVTEIELTEVDFP